MTRLRRPIFIAVCTAVFGLATHPAAAATAPADTPFVPASAGLLAKCSATARAVGYSVPCPTRVPPNLVAFGGCGIDIIGPAKRCPNTPFTWRGWVVGSSTSVDAHLVLTASPRPISNYAKVVNGPAWYPGARVKPLGWVTINHWRMHEVFAPSATNDGSAFAGHVILIWTIGGHTYAVGFHNTRGIKRTLNLDLTLARSIRLVNP